MRPSLILARSQASATYVNNRMTHKLQHTVFIFLNFRLILSYFSLYSYASSPFLPQEMSGKLLGFSPPLIKLIPIELLRYHPHYKGPSLLEFSQARCGAGFDTTGQEAKGEGEEIKGKGEQWGRSMGTTSDMLVCHLIWYWLVFSGCVLIQWFGVKAGQNELET